VQVRSTRSSGVAGSADQLSGAHDLSFANVKLRLVHVAREDLIAVVDDGEVAFVVHALGERHAPVGHGEDRLTIAAAKIQALVRSRPRLFENLLPAFAIPLMGRANHVERRSHLVHIARMRQT
jgi:hypothetical protein